MSFLSAARRVFICYRYERQTVGDGSSKHLGRLLRPVGSKRSEIERFFV